MAITEEDIKLMSDDANKDTFTQCKPALDALKAEKDPSKQKELAKTILQNFVKEKTIYILKTNDLTKNVMAQLTDKIGEITDLDSFLKVAQEKPEALAELKKIVGEETTGDTSSNDTKQESGQPIPSESGVGTDKTTIPDAKDGTASANKKADTEKTNEPKAKTNSGADSAKTDGEQEEDPWIHSALIKLRSRNLY